MRVRACVCVCVRVCVCVCARARDCVRAYLSLCVPAHALRITTEYDHISFLRLYDYSRSCYARCAHPRKRSMALQN